MRCEILAGCRCHHRHHRGGGAAVIRTGVMLCATFSIPAVAAAADDHVPFWGDMEFWSLIAFLGFLYSLKALGLWDALLRSMSTREQRETGMIATAESHLRGAEEVLRQSRGQLEALDETIREILQEAERDATYTRDEITRLARREADASIQRARHEIERVRDQSVHDLFQALAERVAEVTERRLRENLQADDHNRLIEESLVQLTAR